MDLLLAFILSAVIAAGLVVFVIISSTRRAASKAITRHFKSAEYILAHHQPPPEWTAVPWRKRLLGQSPRQTTDGEIMARLDELIVFFEHSPFFEDEWTRQQLLQQLDDERRQWGKSLPAE